MSILLVARVVAGKQVHLKEFLWHCAPAATLSHCLFLFVRKLSAVFSEPGSCSNYVGCVRERVWAGGGTFTATNNACLLPLVLLPSNAPDPSTTLFHITSLSEIYTLRFPRRRHQQGRRKSRLQIARRLNELTGFEKIVDFY